MPLVEIAVARGEDGEEQLSDPRVALMALELVAIELAAALIAKQRASVDHGIVLVAEGEWVSHTIDGNHDVPCHRAAALFLDAGLATNHLKTDKVGVSRLNTMTGHEGLESLHAVEGARMIYRIMCHNFIFIKQ